MIRTRFAPSPTGFLHVGGLRTALFNYLIAKKLGGRFILRIEDTDRQRQVSGAVENIISTLRLFGLDFDEGPGKDGDYGPYIQSERLGIYRKNLDELIKRGNAYYCFCAAERLAQLRREQEEKKVPPRYDGLCRSLTANEVEQNLKNGKACVIRQKVPRTGVTEFDDTVHGHLQFRNDLLDDSVLLKSDGYPVYNFANVVDDHWMKITHVVRGEEFLSSTPKHVLLYKAFGWDLPKFVHLPLLLDTRRKKLSKRMGDVAVGDYIAKGYLKAAILNFIAFLGWSPKTTREIFSLDDLLGEFSIEKINKSGAIFDIAKLDYLNREWRKQLALKPDTDPLFERAAILQSNRLEKNFDEAVLKMIWPQILERIKGPSELETRLPEFDFYFTLADYDAGLLIWKSTTKATTRKNLLMLKEYFSRVRMFGRKQLESETKSLLQKGGVGLGEALWPLRVCLSGQKNSPSPFEIMETLAAQKDGLRKILSRLDQALAKLE